MRRLLHWWHRRRNAEMHEKFCTCQVVAYVWVGRGDVAPGMPMGPGEIEVITYGRRR